MPLEAQRINLLILHLNPKQKWVVNTTPLPLYPREIKLFSNLYKAGWPRGDMGGRGGWGGENLPSPGLVTSNFLPVASS
jgi:hypothetical protein